MSGVLNEDALMRWLTIFNQPNIPMGPMHGLPRAMLFRTDRWGLA